MCSKALCRPISGNTGQRTQEQPCVSGGGGHSEPELRGDTGEGALGLGCGLCGCPSLHEALWLHPHPFWSAFRPLTPPLVAGTWPSRLDCSQDETVRGRAPAPRPGSAQAQKPAGQSAGIDSELTLEPTALQGTRVSESALSDSWRVDLL